jgi:hypothetical protein
MLYFLAVGISGVLSVLHLVDFRLITRTVFRVFGSLVGLERALVMVLCKVPVGGNPWVGSGLTLSSAIEFLLLRFYDEKNTCWWK